MPYPPTVVSLSPHDYDFCAYADLSAEEQSAVEIIKSVLRSHNLPDEPLIYRYAEKYLTVSSDKYNPFVRLKLSKSSWYISLSCGDAVTKKKFRRFDIAKTEDISLYESEIVSAFLFAYPKYAEKKETSLSIAVADKRVREFFSRIVLHGRVSSFEPNAAEVEFFTAYIDKLEAEGLNWKAVPVDLMTDGAIKVRGGRIKLRKKSTYMLFVKSKSGLATEAKNLTLAEYIELQRFWIADCAANKEIYSM